MKHVRVLAVFFALVSGHAQASEPGYAPASVWLEEMTWNDVRSAIGSGWKTAIVPTGGTEQNGLHLDIGKHNWIVHYTAENIAKTLGDALVAPVIAYVPEGTIAPPDGHMKFPGTISVREETFALLLEDTARSLKAHGFTLICFIGDHGGNQDAQKKVAEKLSKEWAGEGVRVLHVSDYYANNGQKEWVTKNVGDVQNPDAHAGFMDAAELMVAHPAGVHKDWMQHFDEKNFETTGAKGDPMAATPEFGRTLLALKVKAAVKQIREAQKHERP